MRHHDSDPHDALNDYLDSLAGAPPADSRAGDLDPDLRDGVDRFFDLAEQAGLDPRATTRTEQPTMATNLTLPASGATAVPPTRSRRRRSLPRWTEHLHLVSTALLIATVIALAVALFSANGIGRNRGTGEGEPNGNFAAVPLATVEPDTETSSFPYPTFAECTVEPMTRAELITHLEAGNVATSPIYEVYERSIDPSAEDAQAIMQTYREWQACGLVGGGIQYQARFQTPWFTANSAGIFWNYEQSDSDRPVSEADIENYVDLVLNPEPVASPRAATGTPSSGPGKEQVQRLPIPAGATPAYFEQGGRAFPTIFAEDIVISGPDTAFAVAYPVDEKTGEVVPGNSQAYYFKKVNGQWLLDTYAADSRG